MKAYWWRNAPNVGDAIAPVLIERLLGIKPVWAAKGSRLLTVGSIVCHSKPGDTLWGSGIHTGSDAGGWRAHDKTFLAVRGPHTRKFVMGRGGKCPEVYGDPALLLPTIHPVALSPIRELAIMPHLDDDAGWNFGHSRGVYTINTGWPWERVITEICNSAHVVSSSLHGVIIAEAYGVPVTWASSIKRPGKFEDYFAGVSRTPSQCLPWSKAVEQQPITLQQSAPPNLLPALLEKYRG